MTSPSPTLDILPEGSIRFHRPEDGVTLRYAVIDPAGPARGTFLVLPGRREFIEKKYLELGRDLVERGFRTIILESRGQGLSSRFAAHENHQRDHLPIFDTLLGDLRDFYDAAVKPFGGPLFASGHSMGGLLLTRWLAEAAPPATAAILTAPAFVIGVPGVAHVLSRVALWREHGEEYAPFQHDYDDRDRRFEHNPLSHDPERYAVIERYFDARPRMAIGGVTWAWLESALGAMKKLHAPGYLERIRIPVLALFGGQDIVTPSARTVPFIFRLPQGEAVVIAGAKHDLMNEADIYRNQALALIDQFLRRFPKR